MLAMLLDHTDGVAEVEGAHAPIIDTPFCGSRLRKRAFIADIAD